MSWNIDYFSALSGNQSAILSWNYDDPSVAYSQVKKIVVVYTDKDITDSTTTTKSVTVSPIHESSGNVVSLVTSYVLENLTLGIEYKITLNVFYDDGSSNGFVKTPDAVSVIPSSAAPKQQTFFISQKATGSFTVNLSLSNDEFMPVPVISEYDLYSKLTHVYVIYHHVDSNIITERFEIDNTINTNYYTQDFTITDIDSKLYEVSVLVVNANGFDEYSDSQNFEVTIPKPGAVENLEAKQTMLIDNSFNPLIDPVSITLSWNHPLDMGDPSLNSYTIYRDSNLIATLLPDVNGNIETMYIDASNLVAGTSYTYSILSNSPETDPVNYPPLGSSVDIVALATPSIISVVGQFGDEEFQVDMSYNLNGFLAEEISFDLSGNNGIGLLNFNELPFIVSDLSNQTTYTHHVRITGTRENMEFNSEFSAPQTITPYAPLEEINNLSVTNVDSSNNPLGYLKFTWTPHPNSNTNVNIFDQSFNLITSVNSSVGYYDSSGLILGTSYTYKLNNSLLTENGDTITSSHTEMSSIPFTFPDTPINLMFVDASMAYSFDLSANNSGSELLNCVLTLVNVSNNIWSDLQLIFLDSFDSSDNLITSGNLLSYVLPGRQYALMCQSNVSIPNPNPNYNSNMFVLSPPTVPVYAFSTPLALSAPVVTNVDSSNNPYNGGNSLLITWILNSGYDETNATYDIYRNGSPVPFVTNVNNNSYVDIGLTNGEIYNYQIVVKIGGLASPKSVISNSIMPFSFPGPVTGLTHTVNSESSATLNWSMPSLNGTGVDPSNILYYIQDGSNNILFSELNSSTQIITNLLPGVSYTHNVVVGVSINNNIYYNHSAPLSVTFGTHATVNAPTNLVLYPSSNSILVDCTDAVDVNGLTFVSYDYSYKLASDNTYGNTVSVFGSSLFYINSLALNQTYTVRLALKYSDVNGVTIMSSYATGNATTQTAPNPVTNLVVTSELSSTITLSWDVDNTLNGASYFSIYRDNEILYSHIQAVAGNILQHNMSTNQWYINDTNVVVGTTYTYQVISEKRLSGPVPVYVVSSSVTESGSAWAAPGPATNVTYVPTDSRVELSWVPSLNTAGAGVGDNSDIQHNVVVINPTTNYPAIIPLAPGLTSYTIVGSYQDTYNNYFTITNGQLYNVSVISFFNIHGNPSNPSVSSPATITVQPRPVPMIPTVTATPTNTNGVGKQITLQLNIDPSSNTNNILVNVTRVIKSQHMTPQTLSSIVNQPVNLTPYLNFSSGSATYIDGPQSNFGIDVDNFLNGNTVEYVFTVVESNWTTGYTSTVSSAPVSAVPSGSAIIHSMAFDNSNNIVLTVHKNGANVNNTNALVCVGFGSNNTVEVKTLSGSNLNFNNELQSNGNYAALQLANYTMSNWTSQLNQALCTFSTANSTALLDVPQGNILPHS